MSLFAKAQIWDFLSYVQMRVWPCSNPAGSDDVPDEEPDSDLDFLHHCIDITINVR